VYDWPARHAAAVAQMRERQPEIVLLGDSITHFWGGEPSGEHVGGRLEVRSAASRWVEKGRREPPFPFFGSPLVRESGHTRNRAGGH